ncbi:uncharacterized protein KY384_001830 [Bacidia gigantensis]|uniref:uncharacterized protein n=1 Tax=Bacidia gigantensis TaxID=2732470 RepID=UPI001D04F9FB|nr:uncharacterized protein KY384_001830 [Bacidia gigantensis]KAG8533047.1 hypothetical protein KY384_001830 [Bacidia gigantensis]
MPLFTPSKIFLFALLLRLTLFFYGILQDAYSPLPYTDIDYFVFTDAARYVHRNKSPYLRETYRYTPLLAWILIPTAWKPQWFWFSFGKLLFAGADLMAGWLLFEILRQGQGVKRGGERMEVGRALKFASVWSLNPMVATISTRGSSEGLLGVMVAGLLWAVLQRRIWLAGVLLGLSVHFKIYPFIYGCSILWYLESRTLPQTSPSPSSSSSKKAAQNQDILSQLFAFFNRDRIIFGIISVSTFTILTGFMYYLYDFPFLQHTYLHHLTRIDHRHNFSVWNTLLHLSSMQGSARAGIHFEKLAFIPQLLLSAILIPLALAKKDLAGAMLCQTWAFVMFNKVVTSQYFLWYLVLLPIYLPYSSLLERPPLGVAAAVLWVGTQAIWLQQAYELEFLGRSTFIPNLFFASLAFFAVNCWILGIMISNIGRIDTGKSRASERDDSTRLVSGEKH